LEIKIKEEAIMKTFKVSLLLVFVGLSGCAFNVAKDILVDGIESDHQNITCYPVPFNTYQSIYVLDTEVNDSLNVKRKIQSSFTQKGFNVLSREEDITKAEFFLTFSYVPMIGKYWTKGAYDRYKYFPTFESFEAELYNSKTAQTVATINYSQKGGDNESIGVILRKFTSRLYKEYHVFYLRQN